MAEHSRATGALKEFIHRDSGPNAAATIGDARLAQVGVQFFERAMLPELVKRPAGLDPRANLPSSGDAS